MTALWFAIEEHARDTTGRTRQSDGVLFAVDVTNTKWYETFQHAQVTYGSAGDPFGWAYKNALEESGRAGNPFRVFPALPDERMKAQEGFFLGAAVPQRHVAPRGRSPPPGSPTEPSTPPVPSSRTGRPRR